MADLEVHDMVVMGDIRKSDTFVAVVHKKNINNKKGFDALAKECMFAEAMGKSMYAIVEKGVDIGIFGNMPWKKVVHFNKKSDISGILTFIDGDIRAGGYYT